ncbi:MAG: site-2 protease family protein [Acidimicrobiia bacterium]
MTFSGDHLEEKSNWSKTRSRVILTLIFLLFVLLIADVKTRGYALVGLALLVTIMLHEAGHFVAAKWAKMKATEFFVGFGPRIWSFKKGETEYGIKAIPVGGYVKIIGMTNLDEVHVDDEHRTYRKGTTRRKLVVILAGVIVNFILAYLLIFASLVGHGIAKESKDTRPAISMVNPGSAAEKIGLKPGDVLNNINGTKILTTQDLFKVISKFKVGEKVEVTYSRKSQTFTKQASLIADIDSNGKKTKRAILGVVPAVEYEKVAPIKAASMSGEMFVNVVKIAGKGMGKLFSPTGISQYSKTVVNGDYQRQDRPSSPAGIVNIGGQLVNQDGWTLLNLMAIVNIFLGLLNLLPLLPLDGGHAFIAIYERIGSLITGKEVVADFKKLMPVAVVVVGILVIFSLSALWLDLLQITS